jgi:hypothetical protein
MRTRVTFRFALSRRAFRLPFGQGFSPRARFFLMRLPNLSSLGGQAAGDHNGPVAHVWHCHAVAPRSPELDRCRPLFRLESLRSRFREISCTRAIYAFAPGTYSLGLRLRNSRYLGHYSAWETKENDGSSKAPIFPAKANDARPN